MSLLASITQHANERKLLFLLIGGHAVILYGVPRNTFDLDLIVRSDDRPAWTEFVLGLGYTITRESPTFLQFDASNKQDVPLDLMFVNDTTFAKMMADAAATPPATGGAKMVSLFHLLGLKCHAIKFTHRGRIEKDLDDVIHLIRANHLDVNGPELRQIILKHGTKELYEKLQRVCGA